MSKLYLGLFVMIARLALAEPAVKPGTMYSLDQFGPVGTPQEAETTFQKAAKDILAAGGGILTIPIQAAPNWIPKNNTQSEIRIPAAPEQTKTWSHGIGMTVIDARGSTPKILPPQTTGLEINRSLNLPQGESLPFWDYYPMLRLNNTILRGSTSYRDWLQETAPAGKDSKFYVATIRGIFPGMFMSIGEYGTVERLCVKSLGYDQEKKLWYFTADTAAGQPKGTIMGNKNHVNILDMHTHSHNENQTFDVRLWRHNYSQGDNYLFDARFMYMGDVHSTAGDENGVIYAAFIEAETDVFRGQVDQWNPATGELKYKNSPSAGKTLGSGRPMINLNPAKWITKGTVMIVQPAAWTDDSTVMDNPVFEGKSYPTTIGKNNLGSTVLKMGGLIRFSADAPVTEEVVGRYFAVDEPDEYVPGTPMLRRWYLIDSVTKNADGTKDLRIVRHWWGAKAMASPRLYKTKNATWDGHLKPLKYVIAPGANAYDVSDGVKNPKQIVRLVPTPFTGTAVDFAANDPIEQAIGPDPFKPIPFRSWVWDAVPGAFPSPIFDVMNHGSVMRDSVLSIAGGSGSYDGDVKGRYDQNPAWDKLLTFDTACNTGIRFGGDTGDAAILFAQPNGRVQPIKWYYGTDSGKPPRVASLTVTRDTGDLNFTGGLVMKAGLSAGEKPARNLRGLNVPVPAGSKEIVVKFSQPESDSVYMAVLQLSWLTNHAIVNRTGDGFTVQFSAPPTANGELSWLLVR